MNEYQAKDLREAANGPLAARLSPRYLDEHCLLPLAIDAEGAVATAVAGAIDATVRDELVRVFGRPLRLIEMPAGEIQAALLAANRLPAVTNGNAAPDDVHALANQAPVVNLVNSLLMDALKTGASDVHLESTSTGLCVRFRLDGVLHEISRMSAQYESSVISRVKIMGGLNIAERQTPQDGRARIRVGDREVDLRVSTVPTLHGESVVVRILDHAATARDLADLGMPEDVAAAFDRLIRRTSGIVLVTGPTGSGKTTTLYGALSRVNRPEVKILTVEDPVEYQIDGVTQIPVNPKARLTFASALRSMLRHDPDLIMVGEMRDRETSEIAVQAALTGHLVFSTLHTNDAPSGITRLVNMGIEPYLVAATVQAILAQRLVRVTCSTCRGQRCDDCAHTGFKGRTGIYELLTLTEELRALIVAGAPLDDIRSLAREQGMRTLYQDGMAKVAAGITTREEVMRVTQDTEVV
jgi:general secretion pathway protein E